MREGRPREAMRRADMRQRTETSAAYDCPRRQALREEQRASPTHQWITQVAQGELEKEDVLVDDPDFLVLPDTRKRNSWSDGDARTVNLLVIFKDPCLRTIRDLRGEHLPILGRVSADVLGTVREMAGVPADEVYCYFNYLPSNPVLLHLHLAWPLPPNRDSLRHHLLSTVIFNLQRDGNYYRDCPLHVAVPRCPRGPEEVLDGTRI